MTRRARKTRPPRLPADPLLLASDLRQWAGDGVAARGRKDALLGRVERLCLAPDGCSVEARVRGNRPLPYEVLVSVAGSDLESACNCARAAASTCKHAVAALEALRFPLTALPKQQRRRSLGRRARGSGKVIQQAPTAPGFLIVGSAERTLTREERVGQARQEELALRKHRARRDRSEVRPVTDAGAAPRFLVRHPRNGSEAEVTLRGPDAALAACTCADFFSSELELCPHIQRVRSWLRRRKKPHVRNLLSLWWRPRPWTERVPDPLREIRIDLPLEELPRSMRRYFDAEGWLRLPTDGVTPSKWAAAAVAAAGRVARRRGWTRDLDSEVQRRIEAAAAEEARADRLWTIDSSCRDWQDVVSDLGFRLHPYQAQGALFLARRGRAFLADDMGLGKTVQAIAAALVLRRMAGARRALVVCPASLKHQWASEIEKACGEQARVIEGPRATRLRMLRDWKDGFLVLNYELVLRDLEAVQEAGAELIVLDEAQRIKNWDTRTARAVKQLESPFAFVLTGTPLENRLLELHSLVEFLHPRALGPRWRLLPYHAVTEDEGRVVAYEGLDVLRNRLRPLFLRRERKAVMNQLPERTDNTFWTGMTGGQETPYRSLASQLAVLVANGGPLQSRDVRRVLQLLTGMRVLCNARAQYDWSEHEARLRNPAPPSPSELRALHSPKLEEFARVLEDLLDEADSKVVVFSQWHRMLRLAHFTAREPLVARDLRAEIFHGGLSSRQRTAMLEAFHTDPEFRVLFSTDAGGLGLNLQDAASIVVNLEVPWNPAVLEQRIGRVHRMGQSQSVQVLHFVTRGAIEERVRQVVEHKRALFRGLLIDEADRITFDEARRTSFLERIRTLVSDSDGVGPPES